MKAFSFILLIFLTFTTGVSAHAGTPVSFDTGDTLSVALIDAQGNSFELRGLNKRQHKRLVRLSSIRGFGENKRVTAVILAVALGTFGVHRLYLGTRPIVPVVYTLTLGGGMGILPLTDIIAILATPDLSRYENNARVIMWIQPD